MLYGGFTVSGKHKKFKTKVKIRVTSGLSNAEAG